ncbi:MAG: response regulator, partial [FCB group bacterium]|nr:response regulator [FCB group bacterium]
MAISKYPNNAVLLVDDEEQLLKGASFALRTSGIDHVETCSDSRLVLQLLEDKSYSVILLDLMMPHLNGD